MDSDDVLTPRSGRKKKSTLSKLAARRRLDDSNDSDSKSASSSWEPNQRNYPIDANVEIRNQNNVDEEESDEGIEVTTDSFSRKSNTYAGHRTLINSDSDQESPETDSKLDSYSNRGYLKGNIEDEIRMKLDNGEKEKSNILSDSEETFETPKIDKDDHVMLVREVLDSGKLDLDENPQGGPMRSKGLIDEFEKEIDGPFRSNLSNGPLSKSTEDISNRYRELLEEKNKEELGDEDELNDSISALRTTVPKASGANALRGAPTAGVYASQDRTWGSLSKFGGFDTMSQRSYQSTSVLPLISTKEARDRSFLVGSMSGRNALMGSDEMERFFPDHKIRIFTGSWNMNDIKLLPTSLDDWLLPDSADYVQDMYIIGTQESCTNRKEWEIRMQETLGPSHVLFHSATHGVLYLTIFLRRDLIWFCSVVEEATVTTRLGPTNIATKGAVGACFTFFGTSFLFVDAHLHPHDGKVKERIGDYNKIVTSLNLPQIVLSNPYSQTQLQDDVTGRFDCVFWMGDLNFRLDKERDRVDNAVQGLENQDIPSYDDLMRHDELFRVRNEGLAFQDFQEGRIKFKPTYKYDKGTDAFDTSKKLRIPSYTDRVLFRCKRKNAVTCLHYNSVPSFRDSDHKPVYALFEVAIRPGKDNIPLAAGQFNRDVWLEGCRRRAERLEKQKLKSKNSSVCSIQ